MGNGRRKGLARVARVGTLTLAFAGGGAATSAAAQTPADYQRLIEGAQPEASDTTLARFTLEELMERFGIPGVSIAVIHDFRIHWAKGYGVRDVETGEPVDVETMFHAASISKPVAAMGSLKAVQDGVFGLDDDINDILTSWQLDGGELTRNQAVTPRMLMSHTSGLGDGFGFPGYEPGEPLPTTVQIVAGHELSNVGPIFMERAPMEAYEYSGGGVTLQELVLSDARGRAFEEVMREQVLEPIGMTRSSFEQPISPENDRNAARAHGNDGDSMGPKWHVYPEMAAAGLWTTPTDLARFAIEVQRSVRGESNRVLSRSMAREMITPVGVGDYAVGFALARRGQGWYFAHGGGNWGFRCYLIAHTTKGYGFAVMTNSDGGGAIQSELMRRIGRAYGWDSEAPPVPRGYQPPPAEEDVVDVDPTVLERYQGTFRMNDGTELVVVVRDERLAIEVSGEAYPLLALSNTEFHMAGVGARVRFDPDDSGMVDAMGVVVSGKSQRAPRTR